MRRTLRFSILLVAALAVVSFLPLYIKRTMLRSWRVDHVGDVIEWGWKICTLESYWSNYSHFSREQNPALWLGVNLALAFIYALVFALIVDRVLERRKRREGRIR
jgi:apolipoprotein N-acyltransferase